MAKSAKDKAHSPHVKPIAGKKIKSCKIGDYQLNDNLKDYLKAPVDSWSSPNKIIGALSKDIILNTPVDDALRHVQDAFVKIQDSQDVPPQLTRFAANCYAYSQSSKFIKDFKNIYSTRRATTMDNNLREQARALSNKALSSATNLTSSALDIVESSALAELNEDRTVPPPPPEHNEEDTIDDDSLVTGPVRVINHPANLPKLTTIDLENIQKHCVVGISNVPTCFMPGSLQEALEANRKDQKVFRNLNGSYPHVLSFLKQLMNQENLSIMAFPQFLWAIPSEANDANHPEYSFLSLVRIVLTDYWGLLQRTNFCRSHERTFWVEYVVPLFKHLPLIHQEFVFSWCESMMTSYCKSQIIPGVWNNSTDKLFSDGVARKNEFEVIIMESSGPFSPEDITHSLEDTWKLITMTTSSLRDELLKYDNASFETAKGLATFGIQCICDKITLIKTNLISPTRWQVLELRSANIPVSWDERTNLMSVFELIATLLVEYQNQKKILNLLRRQNNYLDHVPDEETIKYKFYNSN